MRRKDALEVEKNERQLSKYDSYCMVLRSVLSTVSCSAPFELESYLSRSVGTTTGIADMIAVYCGPYTWELCCHLL